VISNGPITKILSYQFPWCFVPFPPFSDSRKGGTRSLVFLAKPDENFRGQSVDVFHKQNLNHFFGEVQLIDTDSIDPQSSRVVFMPKILQSFEEVLGDTEN
jgi:hypothetical protein